MAVTLKDVAALVGVSVNTVSLALKDKPEIKLKTRERVKAAAEALGYRPNLNARSLVLRQTNTIGVAVTEIDNPVRMEFCERLRSLAARSGYRLLVTSLEHTGWQARNISTLEDLLARRVDGLIIGYIWGIPGEQPLGKILQECRRNEIPAVLFGTPKTELADCVEIDFFDSAYRLTEYLISRGYREIAFFGADILSTRIQGYLQAMNDHGLKDGIQIREEPSNRLQNAAMFMNQYLQECGRPPRAIIAPNDLGAIGIISALKKQGWRVPEDCVGVGIDNIAIGEYFDPPLTSIGFDNGYFAQLVWDLLEKRLKKVENGPARNLKLHQELVIRGSC